MSFIRQFVDRIFGGREKFTVTFAGLDAGGKSTLLYLLKLNQIVNTIPTFGFNVEIFKPPSLTKEGTVKESSTEIIGWDIGVGCEGPRYMVNLLQFYIDGADALVWVVDSSDHERLQESVDKLKEMLQVFRSWKYREQDEPVEGKASRKYPPKPILVLANKQDLPKAKNIDEVRKVFVGALSGSIAAVYPITLMAGLTAASGLPQAFDWLKLAVEISREQPKASGPSVAKDSSQQGDVEKKLPDQSSTRTPGNLASKLNSWLAMLDEDSPPEEFLSQFNNVALPRWDHYTHIRLAYNILKIHGRQKGSISIMTKFPKVLIDAGLTTGKDMIFDGIKKYISESKGNQTTGKSFHFTMTYFWIQIVHFGIQSMNQNPVPCSDHNRAWVEDFARFLIVNPFVVDGQLWMDYYSKEVIMTAIAKNQMVLPDKKTLPSIAARDAVAKLLPPSI